MGVTSKEEAPVRRSKAMRRRAMLAGAAVAVLATVAPTAQVFAQTFEGRPPIYHRPPGMRGGGGGGPGLGAAIGLGIGLGILGAAAARASQGEEPPRRVRVIEDDEPIPVRRGGDVPPPPRKTPPPKQAARTPPSNIQVPARSESRYLAGEVLIEMRNGTAIDPLAQRLGLEVLSSLQLRLTGSTLHRLRANDGRTTTQILARLQQERGVAAAQPNWLYTLQQDAPTPTAATPTPTEAPVASAAPADASAAAVSPAGEAPAPAPAAAEAPTAAPAEAAAAAAPAPSPAPSVETTAAAGTSAAPIDAPPVSATVAPTAPEVPSATAAASATAPAPTVEVSAASAAGTPAAPAATEAPAVPPAPIASAPIAAAPAPAPVASAPAEIPAAPSPSPSPNLPIPVETVATAASSSGPAPIQPLPGQYAADKLNLPAAHGRAKGTGVLVAVIDTGADETHPELVGAVAGGFDALDGVEAVPGSHGTAMAGAIAARVRLSGAAPAARLLLARAFGPPAANGVAQGSTFHVVKCLDWAVASGARVVSMSFAGPADSLLSRSLAVARQKDVIAVAATGNAGPQSPPLYPAADPTVIAVTASDPDDRILSVAVRGGHVAVTAPGVDILVASPQGGYDVTSGTSVAAAEVSGVVALLVEKRGDLTPDEAKRILAATAVDLGPKGRDPIYGAGLVDAEAAVGAVGARTR